MLSWYTVQDFVCSLTFSILSLTRQFSRQVRPRRGVDSSPSRWQRFLELQTRRTSNIFKILLATSTNVRPTSAKFDSHICVLCQISQTPRTTPHVGKRLTNFIKICPKYRNMFSELANVNKRVPQFWRKGCQ